MAAAYPPDRHLLRDLRLQFDRGDGSQVRRINPFGAAIDPSTFVTGPPAADAAGNIYYTAIRFNAAGPWTGDIRGAWLVRVAPDATTSIVSFPTIAVGAPAATDPLVAAPTTCRVRSAVAIQSGCDAVAASPPPTTSTSVANAPARTLPSLV